MVVVRSDLTRIDEVRVRVDGMDERKEAAADDLDANPLPRTVAVVHTGGPLGPIDVVVEGFIDGDVIVSRRAALSFVRGRNLMVEIDLVASCVGMVCTDRERTCIDGGCAPARVDLDDLGEWPGRAPERTFAGSGGRGGNTAGRSGSGGMSGASGERGGSGGSSGASGVAGSMPAAGSGGSASACTDCSFPSGTNEPHATLACVEGACQLTCESGFTDADEDRANGCEMPASAFQWKASNIDTEDASLEAATSDALEVNCAAALDFGSGALPASVEVCGQQLQPVLLPQRSGGSEVVVLAMRQLTVTSGSKLSFAGARPVVVVVYGDAEIQSQAEIDVSAVGTRAAAGSNLECESGTGANGGTVGRDDPAGGGGGGGFGTAGGLGAKDPDGAAGGLGGAMTGSPQLAPLRGGCAGGVGNVSYGQISLGGAGGGALQLSVAGTLIVRGTIAAAGGGGRGGDDYGDGGGGGGSGGALLLEAGRIELPAGGWLSVNGGGGGEGHAWWVTANGAPGPDGAHRSSEGADGGGSYGPGGVGAAGDSPATNAGTTNTFGAGGGGGGGGAGRIVLHSADCEIAGNISPPTSCTGHP